MPLLWALADTGMDTSTIIASYYQGQQSVNLGGMHPDTRRYVRQVKAKLRRYRRPFLGS
ncbi:hypothetical protein [Arthrobacter mobilis]|uniref:Transglycosylase SLT domain-containing protein n=1 Tax=Arthrobacter mobilis TaxID=2724944 RepID=A0A7X6K6U1_9MICC|nr:hypothetical protein [Arthrobacter mobilis]NKX55985.1 hypothetical protein [Arthrobacter mobilis]